MRKKIFTEEEVVALLVKVIKEKHNGNKTSFAREVGYDVGNVVIDVVAGFRRPTARILDALGFERSGGYIKK